MMQSFFITFFFCLLSSCVQDNAGFELQEEQLRTVQETEDPLQVAEKAVPVTPDENIQEEVEREDMRKAHPEVMREKLRNAPTKADVEKVIRVECNCPPPEAQMQQALPAAPAPEPEARQKEERLPGRRQELPEGYDNSSYKPI